MSRPRLIPVVLLKDGLIVRSQNFRTHQIIGNPMSTIERFSHWNADELILLNIGRSDSQDLRRDDLYQRYQGDDILDVLREISKVCFMPLTIGGGIRTLDDIAARLGVGADKCVLNTIAVRDPAFVERAARRFGSQCIVASVDVRREAEDGHWRVWTESGRVESGLNAAGWCSRLEQLGAGEILINSIDRDGTAEGFDLELIASIVSTVSIPVIACGGVGRMSDFVDGIAGGGASAVAAANIFHFTEMSYPAAKSACIAAGLAVRPPLLGGRWIRREPHYDRSVEDIRIEARLAKARVGLAASRPRRSAAATIWCTRCAYSSISAAPMEFDGEGVCMGCRMSDAKRAIPAKEWERRKTELRHLLLGRRNPASAYDCVIPVSGGKDSYYQTHVIVKELGLKPLLVTYNGNNYSPAGWRNLQRMSDVFGIDHEIVSPDVDVLIRLNRLAFVVMGDMNWHAHVGITTVPVQKAVEHRVSTLIWGEHGYADLSGQFSMTDFPEMSYRDRLEHFARGYEWNFFVDREGLSDEDLRYWKYPEDRDLMDCDVRGIYLGNYVRWEANEHVKFVIDEYGFEVSDEPFDRTYRRMSNLDDIHENGVHDYLKYIKFGYGRCTDHASKDIRAGLLSRESAIELIRHYDPVKPRDLARWLKYVGMSENEFDRIADTFRDPRVWYRRDGKWAREDISGRQFVETT